MSDGHLAPDPKYVEFPARNTSEILESKVANHPSFITHENLEDFRSIYNVPQDYELIRPLSWE